jgi:high-affinity iron transporter
MISRIIAVIVISLAAVTLTRPALAGQVNFPKVAGAIASKGEAAIKAYVAKDGADTADKISSLYFDVFEGSGMEAAIGMRDAGLKAGLESLFSRVIGLASRGAPAAKVGEAWNDLRQRLEAAAQSQPVAMSGFMSTLIQSFLILVREGFEAILIITALITYLRRSGGEDKVRVIYHGVGWALAASFLTAYLLTLAIDISGTSREGLEGVTMLVASMVLFYVSYWLISKREVNRWQSYVRGRIDKALSGGKLFTLGFAAFLAVYREGAETVLFYQALSAGTKGQTVSIVIGFLAAAVALAFLYWAMRTASFKLPMGVFFSATAAFLYFLAVTFAGAGVLELQGARWISVTPLEWMPRVAWLGLFPTVESVAAQLVLFAPLMAAALWWLRKRRTIANSETERL